MKFKVILWFQNMRQLQADCEKIGILILVKLENDSIIKI